MALALSLTLNLILIYYIVQLAGKISKMQETLDSINKMTSSKKPEQKPKDKKPGKFRIKYYD